MLNVQNRECLLLYIIKSVVLICRNCYHFKNVNLKFFWYKWGDDSLRCVFSLLSEVKL